MKTIAALLLTTLFVWLFGAFVVWDIWWMSFMGEWSDATRFFCAGVYLFCAIFARMFVEDWL